MDKPLKHFLLGFSTARWCCDALFTQWMNYLLCSGFPPAQHSTSPCWWLWGRWKGRVPSCESSSQDLGGLFFLWCHLSSTPTSAESRKELKQPLHVFNWRVSSSEAGFDVPKHKRSKKGYCAIQKKFHKLIKSENKDQRSQKTHALISAGKQSGVC